MIPKQKQATRISRVKEISVRAFLKLISDEIHDLQQMSEESCRDIPSEYKAHAAAAFAYEKARRIIEKHDRAIRRAVR